MRITSVNYMSSREEAEEFIEGLTGIQLIALKSPTQLRWYSKYSDNSKDTIAIWKASTPSSGCKLGTMEIKFKFVPLEYCSRIKEII